MSVAALIYNDGKPERNIPISTEAAFEELWKPGIEHLQLQWLGLFQTGLDVRLENWPEISGELLKLRRWAVEMLAADEREYLLQRIDRLLRELSDVLRDSNHQVWIG